MDQPILTIIIPVPPGAAPPPALQSLPQAVKGTGPVEVILAAGRAAAQQRNQAAEAASAPILYFLDDDSCLGPDTVSRGLELMRQTQAAAVGGPALTWPQASFWERCFGEVVASRFGTLRLSARSLAVGRTRRTDGEELILCNLMIDRAWLKKVQGLDEQLYPGEDVDLWRRLREHGAPMYYDPGMIIHRGRRRHVAGFALQHFRYGQGRGCRFGHHAFRLAELAFLVPALFALYLGLLLPAQLPLLPLGLYLALCAAAGASISRRSNPRVATCSAFLFPVLHLSYGLGIMAGLLGYRPPITPGPPDLKVLRY